MKTSKLRLGQREIFALENSKGELIEYKYELLRTVENFHRDLYEKNLANIRWRYTWNYKQSWILIRKNFQVLRSTININLLIK